MSVDERRMESDEWEGMSVDSKQLTAEQREKLLAALKQSSFLVSKTISLSPEYLSSCMLRR